MSTKKPVSFDNFTLKRVKISKDGVDAEYTEKRQIDGGSQILEQSTKAKYLPHPDLINYRDTLKEYLVNALSLDKGFNLALKYTKGEQKAKVEESILDLYKSIEVTGISIAGEEQLRGVVISGKIESYNGSKCAINTPRIVFSSEKIGFELDVEGQVEMIEREVYKYLFEGKKAQAELFDSSDDEGNPPKAETISKGKKEPAPAGLS